MAEDHKLLHLLIHGRVQGVWYRDSMRREAEVLGVNGWVRNRRDGTVEAMVQGAPDAVDALARWAQRGPERAAVERVQVEAGSSEHTGFEIKGTA